MNTRPLLVLVLLLMCAAASACGPSRAEVAKVSTQEAEAAIATLTAAAPTATRTSTPTGSPTNAPIATPTRTPTQTPTYTPTPSPTRPATKTSAATLTEAPTGTPAFAARDEPPDTSAQATPGKTKSPPALGLGEYLMTLEDMPEGFIELGKAQVRSMEEGLPQGSAAFGYTNELETQIIIGMLMPVDERTEQRMFDAQLPYLAQIMATSLGAEGDAQELDDLDDIGEARAGISTVSEMGVMSFLWDVVIFRRAGVGAYLIVMWLDGEETAIEAAGLARMLDKRIQQDWLK